MVILADSWSVRGGSANDKINVALVGVGGRGTWFVETIPRMENVVAICDVDGAKIAGAYKRWAGLARLFAASKETWERSAAPAFERLTEHAVPAYRDFRKMIEEMDRKIDAIVVATPDHTHAVASAAAIRAGKHVFCEKPLTRTVRESRTLLEMARKSRVATSMGNQGTASGPFRRALELVRNGTLGEIKEVHVWNSAGGADRKELPQGSEPVPEELDWDLWLGPAAFRPFHRLWLSRHNWREFGTSQVGNWASHSANLAFMALRVHELWQTSAASQPAPIIRVEAKCSGLNRLSFPRWETVRWDIPGRAGLPPISFTWHNGPTPGGRELLEGLINDGLDWGDKKEKRWMDHGGSIIAGTKGVIHATAHNATFRLLPEDQFRGLPTDAPQTVEASRGHEGDWFASCRGGKPAWASFEYAAPLNEFLMLGNVATQCEGKIEFDPLACRIVNDAAADRLLRTECRQGWVL
jgi:hypothetical protein